MDSNKSISEQKETRFTLRIDNNLFDEVKKIAKINKRSSAKQIEFILEEWLRQYKDEE